MLNRDCENRELMSEEFEVGTAAVAREIKLVMLPNGVAGMGVPNGDDDDVEDERENTLNDEF